MLRHQPKNLFLSLLLAGGIKTPLSPPLAEGIKVLFSPPLAGGDEGEGGIISAIQALSTPTLALPRQGGGSESPGFSPVEAKEI